ncbi:Integrase catalytic domain-containing protein, partial [Aphis craccivora]
MLEADFLKLHEEKGKMTNKGSGFSLNRIDCLIILTVGSSYLPLPTYIENKKATIYIQNIDNKCLKYSILAKHVNPIHAERIGSNYTDVEDKYDFSNLNFPVMIKDIKEFERLINVSV